MQLIKSIVSSLLLTSLCQATVVWDYQQGATKLVHGNIDIVLDEYQAEYPNHRIVITSGYRTKCKQLKLGGKLTSHHLKPGTARDIRIYDMPSHLRHRLRNFLCKRGLYVLTEHDHFHVSVSYRKCNGSI